MKEVLWKKPFEIIKGLKVLNVFQLDSDPEHVWANANVTYNGVRLTFRLFAPQEDKPWTGRFPGIAKPNADGVFIYWHFYPFENPATGLVSGGYTKDIEDIFAKVIGQLCFEENEEDHGVDGVEAAILAQCEAVAESNGTTVEEVVPESTTEEVEEK